MIKSVADEVWAFDCEWVPDILAGRLLYGLPDDVPQSEVLRVMWEQGGATEENPMPFLKTVLCRVVSVATVIRRAPRGGGEAQLFLQALPENPDDDAHAQDEAYILRRFLLDGLAARNPQLVGFNSRNADLRILLQRAFTHGIDLKAMGERMNAKPWESRDVDLMELISGFGRQHAVSLNEVARLSGIPGKMDVMGEDVCGLWYSGRCREIVNYNCFDALTTYLVWLRTAHVSGHFTQERYRLEQRLVRRLIEDRAQRPDGAFLLAYLDEWRNLKQRTGQDDGVFE
ncbi:MAG: 3'-5' exonuclease [Kiritimatiellaeota bacterium]|nr:3'-5' exonuclease [Kiritimatiellota bacterium]